MSEAPISAEHPPVAPGPEAKKTLPSWMRWGIVAAIALIIMIILVLAGNAKAKQAEASAYERMGNALAESFAQDFFDRKWAKTEQELVRIANAGNFAEITLTDLDGRILASTSKSSANPERLKDAPAAARVSMEPGIVRIERKVGLAQSNPQGAMRILVRR